jgi:predicted RNA-binding Zn-ribbon protein involved in translation (DUF1610 family)
MTMVAPRGEHLERLRTGDEQTRVAPGGLSCVACAYVLTIEIRDTLPRCPACGGEAFRRASIFSRVSGVETFETRREPDGVRALRAELEPGTAPLLAWCEAEGELRTHELGTGWTRIGRSGSADLRLDDPTVSRRHALVVLTDESTMRALDDRSLNGLFVNGERVEWAPLADGDELEIGRYRIYVVTS